MKVVLNTDGGARGNPGPGAAGIVIQSPSGEIIKELGLFLGVCTNNEAEYKALILGLETALNLKVTEIECNLDSELVVKQLNGLYKVKDERMKVFFQKVTELSKKFASITFRHIPRKLNSTADRLVNEVLDANSK